MKQFFAMTVVVALVALAVTGAAATQETRTLDLDASGVAESRATGEVFDLDVTIEGDVVVTSSGEGVDRAAYTLGPAVTLTISVDGTAYEVQAQVGGEGVSLVQTGVTADGWRLSAQGSTFGEGAQFRGSLILLGAEDGYTVSGDGVLTVQDGATAVSYGLSYTGAGTFA